KLANTVLLFLPFFQGGLRPRRTARHRPAPLPLHGRPRPGLLRRGLACAGPVGAVRAQGGGPQGGAVRQRAGAAPGRLRGAGDAGPGAGVDLALAGAPGPAVHRARRAQLRRRGLGRAHGHDGVIPGEPINCFVERSPPPRARPEALRRGCALARRLICDVGPTLEALAPVAWHRDVNPHNILIASAGAEANFWLIDFGLAVDSQSWVGSEGGWRAEYIGGDSRYWPPSSWVMHLLGPDGLDDSPDLCDQYQRRLDVHGLGITALELICSLALRAPAAGAEEVPSSWEPVLQAWASYRESVWQWWALVYHAFSTGADIAPVQAGLLQEGVVEKLVALLARARGALRSCAEQLHGRGEEEDGRLLCTVADMLDEAHAMDIAQAYGRLASPVRALPADRVLRPAPPASSPAAAAPAARQVGALGA
ncbi:unnamed protein product, partial [Prorocentrum cordatum]